ALDAQRDARGAAQHGGPAQVISGAVHGLEVGAAALVVHQGQQRQQGRRGAGAAEALGREGGEVLVSEQPLGGDGELAVEALRIEGEGKDVADIEQIALRLPFSEHDVLLPYILPRDRFIITRANSPSIFRSTSADFSAALLARCWECGPLFPRHIVASIPSEPF